MTIMDFTAKANAPTLAVCDGGDEQKVTFTPEQQAKIDEIIRERMGAAGREAREEAARLSTDLNSLRAELAVAKEALAKAKTPGARAEANEEVTELRNRIDEMVRASEGTRAETERLRQAYQAKEKEVESERKNAENIRKQVAMRDAASRANFFDPNVVVSITERFVQWNGDKNRFYVVNESGTERMNAAYEPMSLEEFYADYAAKNPWMVRGDTKSGAGSSESQRHGLTSNGRYQITDIFGAKSNSALALKLKRENPAEYARLKAEAISGGLIAP